MPHKILVVDSDDDYQKMIRRVFGTDCRVIQATTLADAENELLASSFDLILLDAVMPDGDGFSFYAKLRTHEQTANVPVIFVTAKAEASSELMGFSLGAEDYITKPVDPPRLKARVDARLKLLYERAKREMNLCKGNLKLSISQQKVSLISGGKEVSIDLTPVEFKLLFYFLRHEDHVFSREQLLQAVWENAAEVFDRTVDMHVSKLRKKITDSNFQIKAVHGMGYRLSKTPKSELKPRLENES